MRMPPTKSAARKKKTTKRTSKPAPPRTRAKARRAGGWQTRLPILEQRHWDLVGLALVALGVLLAFPLYTSHSAGRVGSGAVTGLRYVGGLVAYAAPPILVTVGAILVLRPVLPGRRPLRSGAICLIAATALALAAGTLGLGPGAPSTHTYWQPHVFEARGGIVGEAMRYGGQSLVGAIGTHIIAVFLFLAGLLLVTGATIAGVLRATGNGVVDTTRAMRRTSTEVAVRGGPKRRGQTSSPEMPDAYLPPEPEDAEVVVTATHVEAPPQDGFWSGPRRFPDLFGNDDDDERHDAPEPPAAETADDDEEPKTAVAAKTVDDESPPAGIAVTDAPTEPLDAPDQPADVNWELPQPTVLKRSTEEQARPDTAGQGKTAAQLLEALSHFNVEAKVVATVTGPHITRYELRLAPGIKMSKVAQLKDDLAYALAATDIRILAPIPGKTAVGVEVPNLKRKIVRLGDVYQEPPKDWSPLTVWLGKDVSGKAIGADLAKMPHLLVAGTTGAGKSGAINAMLSSILLRATPKDVRMVLVDPKQVELNHYEAIPHLLTPVITSPRQAANALANLVREMEWRYGVMSMKRTRSLIELNKERVKQGDEPLPYILCVIDELADLMMVAPADVEDAIIRLAQKARAVGIHLVLATQSPRVDVITGMIKANVPSRIAFAVSSQIDSRVILDQNGAESLLGQGDMLFSPVGTSKLQRIQGAYIDEPQIAALTSWWAQQGEPEVREDLLDEVEPEPKEAGGDEDGFDPDEDAMLGDAIELVVEMGTASTSMLQRRLRLGYTRAGRLIDMLERRGIISGYEGSKPRQVLVTEADLPRVLAALDQRAAQPALALTPDTGVIDAIDEDSD
jgi:DNA segregation ATPase FtsK/SpoIIIE, S-DNA-T family